MTGYATRYSPKIAHMEHWERMARTPIAERFRENQTTYPMSPVHPKEFDQRYLPVCDVDPLSHQPLTQVGEPGSIPGLPVPVIFVVDVKSPSGGHWIGRRHQTRYVASTFMREELHPNNFAVYATPENYKLLGLPVVDHQIHSQIPRSIPALQKYLSQKVWQEEPWRFSFEYMFRHYEDVTPTELQDDPEEDLTADDDDMVVSADLGKASKKGPIKNRKAKKVKLF